MKRKWKQRISWPRNILLTPELKRILLACASMLFAWLVLRNEIIQSSISVSTFELDTDQGVTVTTTSPLKDGKSILSLDSSSTNAIVYLAQKAHKVYLRNSSALLTKSLDLLFQNYLLINHHYLNTSVIIFHTGDFTSNDLAEWNARYCSSRANSCRGIIQLVNLSGSPYWRLPPGITEQDLTLLWKIPKFNLGYRHMIRWYAVGIWDFFREINQKLGTNFRYVMRMDEESFIHSPISYDLFHYMSEHDYFYAFRQCSYEMNAIQRMFHNYTTVMRSTIDPRWNKNRQFNGGSCGFYNNWFIGSVDFFLSKQVQHMLHWFDHKGFIYRDRLNDLAIQTAAVYAFCPTNKIHRFLDWSYEHFTVDGNSNGCPIWGALSTGFEDNDGKEVVARLLKNLQEVQCVVDSSSARRKVPQLHVSYDHVKDLSPSYNHLPLSLRNISLLSVKAGKIDLPGRGEKSG